MPGIYSPLLLNAGAGLMNNQGLEINETLISNRSTYRAIDVVAKFREVIAASNGARQIVNPAYSGTECDSNDPQGDPEFIDDPNDSPQLAITTSFNDHFPEASDSIPPGFAILTNPQPPTALVPSPSSLGDPGNRFTDQLWIQANNILGNGDLSKFLQSMDSMQSVKDESDQYINALEGVKDSTVATFDSMDDLSTGSVASVSKASTLFADDLENAGQLIELSRLDTFGTPEYIMRIMDGRGLFAFFKPEIESAKLSIGGLTAKLLELEEDQVPPIIQKKFYQALQLITGKRLADFLTLLEVKTNGLQSAADILNVAKLFPRSFYTITAPTVNGLEKVYENKLGAVNEKFSQLGKEFYSVLPKDQIDAAYAVRESLLQVRNITQISATGLIDVTRKLESNFGLDVVNNLSVPVPSNVQSFYDNEFAQGTGVAGRYYIADGVGTPAGIVHNDELPVAINHLKSIDFSEVITLLDDLKIFFTDAYNNDSSRPLGEYCDESDPIGFPGEQSRVTNTATLPAPIGTTVSTYTAGVQAYAAEITPILDALLTETPYPNGYSPFVKMAEQMKRELGMFEKAEIVFEGQRTSPRVLQGLMDRLHTMGKENAKLGPAELLDKLAIRKSHPWVPNEALTGESIIGSLREGRNIDNLAKVGIGIDAIPEPVIIEEEADTSKATYDPEEL